MDSKYGVSATFSAVIKGLKQYKDLFQVGNPKSFKAGVLQFDVQNGQIDANMTVIFNHLERLSQKGVSLVVLPEMFSCGFDNENLLDHAAFTPKILKDLGLFAKENQMAIAGSLPIREKNDIFNTMVFFDVDGTMSGSYKKVHLFKLTNEHLHYRAGDQCTIFDTSFGRIGLMICYDLRFPELARTLFKDGAQMLLVSAQWPLARREHWKTLAQARAIENQLFVVCTNRTGSDGALKFPGESMIIDPKGEIIATAGQLENSTFAQIEPGLVKETRNQIPCMRDMRSDVYR